MIVIRLGKWQTMGKNGFFYERILFKGYKWTPFCKKTKRYKQVSNNEIITTIESALREVE